MAGTRAGAGAGAGARTGAERLTRSQMDRGVSVNTPVRAGPMQGSGGSGA